MVSLDTTTERHGGVTLVRAVVTNDKATPQAVTLRQAVDGPSWSPRRDGTVVTEWDDETWTDVIGPGQSRGLGFATPTDPSGSPLEIVSVERAEDDQTQTNEVIASLEEWVPPHVSSEH
jgi:hypothetical protein